MSILSFCKYLFLKSTDSKLNYSKKSNNLSKLFPFFDNSIVYQYDINKLVWVFSGKCADTYSGDFYLMPLDFFDALSNMLGSINSLLKEAYNKHKNTLPLFNYNKLDLCLTPTTKDVFDCCMFFYHPIGYKGKEAKESYSINLKFGQKCDDHFKVFYNRKGEIEKIDCFCFSKYCYRICFTNQKGNLDLYCIYKMENSTNLLLYGAWENKSTQKTKKQ